MGQQSRIRLWLKPSVRHSLSETYVITREEGEIVMYMLNIVAEDVFAGEPDIKGTWDVYVAMAGNGSRAVFLYCRENGRLKIDEDPKSWDYYNDGVKDETPAHELAEDVMYVAAIRGYCQSNGQIIVG